MYIHVLCIYTDHGVMNHCFYDTHAFITCMLQVHFLATSSFDNNYPPAPQSFIFLF